MPMSAVDEFLAGRKAEMEVLESGKVRVLLTGQELKKGGTRPHSNGAERSYIVQRSTHDTHPVFNPVSPTAHSLTRVSPGATQQRRGGGASAASEQFCDALRSKDGEAKTASSRDLSKSKLLPSSLLSLRFYRVMST